jgi:hypothetical protein
MNPFKSMRRVFDHWKVLSPRWIVTFGAAVLCAACTYADPEVQVRTRNVALSPDGAYLAVMVEYERLRRPTGLAAFPDGGITKKLDQRADLYVVDLGTRSMVFEGSVPAPSNRQISFSPWLVGWTTDRRVYFKITGCPDARGSQCHGDSIGSSLYAYTMGESITEVESDGSAVLRSRITGPSKYVNAGTESYGISVSQQSGTNRSPLMQFAGERLILVPQ